MTARDRFPWLTHQAGDDGSEAGTEFVDVLDALDRAEADADRLAAALLDAIDVLAAHDEAVAQR